ncbi:MAG: hypothetical protein AAF810_05355 [Cyanobacteria bacterium P01_D01_bin.36]
MSRADILQVVGAEQGRLEVELERHARRLVNGQGTVADFERSMALSLKESHLRMTALGAGGEKFLRQSPLASKYFGAAGYQLRQQYGHLSKFAGQIIDGQDGFGALTVERLVARSRRYAQSVISAYNRADLMTKVARQGHNEAWRSLGVAKHCPDCPAYQTNGYISIDEVVAVGVACVCGGRCHCTIKTRFNPDRGLNNVSGLMDAVMRTQINSDKLLILGA